MYLQYIVFVYLKQRTYYIDLVTIMYASRSILRICERGLMPMNEMEI